MTKVATRFDVSSSFLARVCARLNVPRPPRGYWAKLEVGKAPNKPPLPEPQPGDELEWTRGGALPHQAPRALPKPPERKATDASAPKVRQREVHALIAGARQFFEGAKEADSGHLRPSKRRLVDLYVSAGALDRSLKVANKLFLALEREGYRVTFAPFDRNLRRPTVDERISERREDYGYGYGYGKWSPDRPTVVYIGTVAIGLTLFEISEEIEARYVDGKWTPVKQLTVSQRLSIGWHSSTTKHHAANGKLCLRATSPYSLAEWERRWTETKKGELGGMVPSIVEELTTAATTVAKLVEEGERRAEEQRREWQRQHEQWEREERERQRLKNIKESRDDLDQVIADWAEAKRIEAFFEDIALRAANLPDQERRALLDRVHRARELLGGTDALQRFAEWESPEER